jgi:hypothetical protein
MGVNAGTARLPRAVLRTGGTAQALAGTGPGNRPICRAPGASRRDLWYDTRAFNFPISNSREVINGSLRELRFWPG